MRDIEIEQHRFDSIAPILVDIYAMILIDTLSLILL